MKLKKTQKGFTLIEILVVSTIIVVLMAIGAVSYTKTNQSSRNSRRQSDLEQVRQALEMYRSENGFYPNVAAGNITNLNTALVTGGYMSSLPTDPKSGTYYRYVPLGSAPYTRYALCATQEDSTNTTTNCTGASACGTSVTCRLEVNNP